MNTKYKRDDRTGALLNTDNAALLEYKVKRVQLKKINSLETQNEEVNRRLSDMEQQITELKTLLIEALKK